MPEAIEVSFRVPASARTIYQAWMNSRGHSEFTGSPALIDPVVGGKFTAWNGYIQGETLELHPYTRIVQSWRTGDFPEGSPDSNLEILLIASGNETQVTLVHTMIPDGQSEGYREGWQDFYFKPMVAHYATSQP